MTSKHTLGPWFLRPSIHNVTGATITTQSGSVIATARNQDDARLIAAAPDLLVALECLVETINRSAVRQEDFPALRYVYAVIAKARGED